MKWNSTLSSEVLKREYQAELQGEKIRLTRILMVLAALFNVSFLVLDQWAIPSAVHDVWVVRAYLFAALAITFCITWYQNFQRIYPYVVIFSILAMGTAINAMIYLAQATDLARDVYYAGLLLVTMGLYTLTYVSLYLSLALSLVLIGEYAAIAVVIHGYLAADKIVVLAANLFFFVSITIAGIVAQSVRERYSRENYLLRHSLERDVELKEEEKKRAAYLAEHDALTGLPNRTKFETDAGAMIESACADGKQAAFMFIDLDGFKPVNDNHGHAVGDRVLQVVATRLSQCLRDEDIIGRLGGDEFVVGLVVPDEHGEIISIVGEKIAAAVGEEIILRGQRLRLSASIGVASAPHDGDDLASVLVVADKRMYEVKQSGKAGIAMASGGKAS